MDAEHVEGDFFAPFRQPQACHASAMPVKNACEPERSCGERSRTPAKSAQPRRAHSQLCLTTLGAVRGHLACNLSASGMSSAAVVAIMRQTCGSGRGLFAGCLFARGLLAIV